MQVLGMGTTINIEPALRDRLKTYGTAGETYNDILKRLMDNMDREAFFEEVRRAAALPEGEWVGLDDVG
ncbi:MAG: hypothetical protein LC620_02800 [Halobacteriales archaeon]|nr:hypothetical protein [Halobacteriales archaeon]